MPSPGSSKGTLPSPMRTSGAAVRTASAAAASAGPTRVRCVGPGTRRPRPGRARGPASKRLPDRREHPALDRLVLGRERLVRVYPEDAFALEDAALHRDRRSVPPLGLEVDPQPVPRALGVDAVVLRSEEHTSELQSLRHLVCRLLLE